jgi:hypothetical protein
MRVNGRDLFFRSPELVSSQCHREIGCIGAYDRAHCDKTERDPPIQERRPFNAQFHPRAYADFVLGGNQRAASVHVHYPALPSAGSSPPQSPVTDPQVERKTNFGTPLSEKSVRKCIWLTIFYRIRGHRSRFLVVRVQVARQAAEAEKKAIKLPFSSLQVIRFCKLFNFEFTPFPWCLRVRLCTDLRWSRDDRPSLLLRGSWQYYRLLESLQCRAS